MNFVPDSHFSECFMHLVRHNGRFPLHFFSKIFHFFWTASISCFFHSEGGCCRPHRFSGWILSPAVIFQYVTCFGWGIIVDSLCIFFPKFFTFFGQRRLVSLVTAKVIFVDSIVYRAEFCPQQSFFRMFHAVGEEWWSIHFAFFFQVFPFFWTASISCFFSLTRSHTDCQRLKWHLH